VLGNPPLKLVICQMRYPRQLGLSEAGVRPVQQALAQRYPESSVGHAVSFTLAPGGVSTQDEAETVFQFKSSDAGWTVTVTADSTSLETTAYVDFSDFLGRWMDIAAIVCENLGLAHQSRIGLRYVNELPCPSEPQPHEIARLLRPELVSAVGAHERTSRLLSSMQEMRFAQHENGFCALRHGLTPRPGGDGAMYVLDIDFYDDRSAPLALDQQARLLAEFNHGAFELLTWAITPEHFATFDPRQPADA
jgi:uncharacterized protein (TIGR04255 family)